MDLTTRVTFVSKNAVFYEYIFPYSNSIDSVSQQSDSVFFFYPHTVLPIEPFPSSNYSPFQAAAHPNTSPIAPQQQTLRQSERVRKPPSYIKYFHCNYFSTSSATSSHTPYPLSSVLSYSKLSSNHLHFTLSFSIHDEPKTYNQAIKNSKWADVMNLELAALHKNKHMDPSRFATWQNIYWM